ncbi:MAG: D-alanyl-D-alanine carboxypeptidase family protein [Oscillospiraceae bacterium]
MKKVIKTAAAVLAAALFCFGMERFFPDKVYLAKSAVLNFFGGDSAKLAELGEIPTERLSMEELIERGARIDDSLMLINGEHPLPEGYEPELAALGGGEVYVNSCAAEAYAGIKEAVRQKFGTALYIMSAYRTEEEQEAAAESEGNLAAAVGASEHQAGLGIDVYVRYFAGEGFLKSPEGQFVNSYCQDYGFIIRYPSYGKETTGMDFEPWHIRYVGKPHSEIIAENGLTLEEYIFSLREGEFYSFGDYVITRQALGEDFAVPEGLSGIVISKDNTGFVIITGKK